MAGELDTMKGFYDRAPLVEVSKDGWSVSDQRDQDDMAESICTLVRTGRTSDLARLVLDSTDQKLAAAVTRLVSANRRTSVPAETIPMPADLLNVVCAVPVFATHEPLLADKVFVEGLSSDGQLLIRRCDGDFGVHFLEGRRVLSPTPSDILICQELVKDFPSISLAAGLGGKEKVMTTLAAMLQTVKRQGLGQQGPLHVDWLPNRFFILDNNQVLCQVTVRWDNGWWFFADDAMNEVTVPSETRIFCPRQEPHFQWRTIQIGVTGRLIDGNPMSLRQRAS